MSSLLTRLSISGTAAADDLYASVASSSSSSSYSSASQRKSFTASMTTSSTLGSLTKSMTSSVSGAISSLPSLSSAVSREEREEKERQKQVASVMTLLQDVRLQCPQTHAGLVIAYTAATLSPINSAGVKFTWYRMERNKDQFNQGTYILYTPLITEQTKI